MINVVTCILPFPMIQRNRYLDHHVHKVKEISLVVRIHNCWYREPKRKKYRSMFFQTNKSYFSNFFHHICWIHWTCRFHWPCKTKWAWFCLSTSTAYSESVIRCNSSFIICIIEICSWSTIRSGCACHTSSHCWHVVSNSTGSCCRW